MISITKTRKNIYCSEDMPFYFLYIIIYSTWNTILICSLLLKHLSHPKLSQRLKAYLLRPFLAILTPKVSDSLRS